MGCDMQQRSTAGLDKVCCSYVVCSVTIWLLGHSMILLFVAFLRLINSKMYIYIYRHTQTVSHIQTYSIYTYRHTNINLPWIHHNRISHSIGLLQSWLFALTLLRLQSVNHLKENRSSLSQSN